MSLFNTIKTGASGLGASGSSLGVIGDNIANLNTRGFKKGRIAFADIMPQYIGSVAGVSQLGRGATTSAVNTMHMQGGFQSTGSALDLAIGGDGFFQVSDGTGTYFTRDGSFRVDKDNYVTTLGGLQLMGYPATNGVLSGQAGPLQLETSPMPPQVTRSITMTAALDPSASMEPDGTGDTTPLTTAMAGADGSATAPAMNDLTAMSDWSTSITVYDSLGQQHEVTLMFERTGENTWNFFSVVDGSEIDADGDGAIDDVDGKALMLDSGTLTFDDAGNLTDQTLSGTRTAAQWPGAADWQLETYDFGFGSGAAGSLTQNADASTAISLNQDGYPISFLTNLMVEDNGTIVGNYDNGESRVLGQVALARFNANDGLARVGGNLYQATLQSGDPTLGLAGTGGRGEISGYALESSNVDLEDEFVAMIQSQRSYQANASTIRTSDESLQTLVQLV